MVVFRCEGLRTPTTALVQYNSETSQCYCDSQCYWNFTILLWSIHLHTFFSGEYCWDSSL